MEQAQSLRDIMNKKRDTNVQVLTVTSAKGGVGKSCVALNMAIAMNRRGRHTLLIDMDLGLANIDVMLGVKTKQSLSSVIQGKAKVTDIIETGVEGVKFISGGSGVNDLIDIPPQQLHRIISNLLGLRDVADTLIFDTGAGISDSILRLIGASHATMLVTTPEPTAIMDAYALIKQVNAEKMRPNIQLILNKAESEREASAALAGFIQIAEKYTDVEINKLGYILRDQHMVTSVKRQVPVLVSYPNCIASNNIEVLADRFLNCESPAKNGLSGFFDRLLGRSAGGWM